MRQSLLYLYTQCSRSNTRTYTYIVCYNDQPIKPCNRKVFPFTGSERCGVNYIFVLYKYWCVCMWASKQTTYYAVWNHFVCSWMNVFSLHMFTNICICNKNRYDLFEAAAAAASPTNCEFNDTYLIAPSLDVAHVCLTKTVTHRCEFIICFSNRNSMNAELKMIHKLRDDFYFDLDVVCCAHLWFGSVSVFDIS